VNKIILPESFPNLPSAIQKIQQMFVMDNVNSTILVQLLEEEPLLCANILKLVNSVHYALSHKVTSIKHAVMLLGTTVIRGIAMATMLKKSFPLDLSPYKISIEQFDTICILRTRLLSLWLQDENIDIQILSAVAFLIESGKIVTANEILKENICYDFFQLLNEHPVLEAETLLFGINSYQVASMLFKQWQFDEKFTELILGALDPKTYEQKVLSVVLSVITTEGVLSDENIEKSIELLRLYDLNATKFIESVNILKKELV
jgi:HD-like signal output (HDOD) protein